MTQIPNSKARSKGRPKGSKVQEEVLEKAGAAFVEHGYHQCTVENILTETGVSRTNFYRFYKNKESVFEAIFIKSIEDLAEQMQEARNTVDPELPARERIEYLLEKYLWACFSKDDLLPIMIQESDSLPSCRVVKEEVLNRFFNKITETIVNDGNARPEPLLVEGFMAAVDRIMLLESKTDVSNEQKVERCKHSLLKFVDVLIQPREK